MIDTLIPYYFDGHKKLFDNGLPKIEEKHSGWLKGRVSMFFKVKQDKLIEHLLIETTNIKRMGFYPKSELPDYIIA